MLATILLFSAFLQTESVQRPTVAIAPFTTTSTQEYEWIGLALADALSLRVHKQSELNALTLRQVKAAIRHDNIDVANLMDDKTASALGRQLGADFLLVGSYVALWPDIEIHVKTLDPQNNKVIHAEVISGNLDELTQLEARLAQTLAKDLGAKDAAANPGAFGTASLQAWRSSTLGASLLLEQSLSPEAADPNVPLRLPASAIGTAEKHLEHATKVDADFGNAWATLGIAQILKGDEKAAWRSFGKASALGAGHDPTAALGATFVRMRQGRWDDAANILKTAIERHPGFLHARGYLGQLYNRQGRHREALAAFDAYLSVAPHQAWALAQRGYTKSKLKDHVGAIDDTLTAVKLLPESPSLLVQLASRYIDAGKLVGAEDALQQAIKADPQESIAYVRLGYVYLLQGKDSQAITVSEKALTYTPNDTSAHEKAYAHLNLARAYGHQGDLNKAFEHLQKAKAAGIKTFDEIENDSALNGLRSDARYKKISS